MQKRFVRSKTNRMLAGVCGGIAEYFGLDATLVRLGFAVATVFWLDGMGFIIYLAVALIVPTRSKQDASPSETLQDNVIDLVQTAEKFGDDVEKVFAQRPVKGGAGSSPQTSRTQKLIGLALVLGGGYLLLDNLNLVPWHQLRPLWFGAQRWWPLLLVAAGLAFVLSAKRSKP